MTVGPRTAALLQRVELIERALAKSGGRVEPEVSARAQEGLTEARERLALGVDHTVVALLGGTGSGKSSLFNAISGLQFAEVGVHRPTTAEVTACAWAHDAGALLDWLEVPTDRRIERESALDADTQADLRGLVLLDMPDFDSVAAEHRAVVDELLPLIDLIVWVVDPQKYADDALHTGYLKHLGGHEGSMLVLLNQIDLIPPETHGTLLRDISRLLREDELVGVDVHGVSARTGAGLPVIRSVLARAVARRGLAETRVAAELDDVVRILGHAVGPVEADVAGAATAALTEFIAAAGVADSVAAVRRADVDVRVGPVQPDRVALARQVWLDRVGAELPPRWRAEIASEVPRAPDLAAAADDQLAGVVSRARPPRAPALLRLAGAGSAVIGLAGAGLTLGTLLGGRGWVGAVPAALVGGGGLLLAVALLLAAAATRHLVARRRADTLAAAARRALVEVVDTMLVQPSAEILEDHRVVRELLAAAGVHSAPRDAGSTP